MTDPTIDSAVSPGQGASILGPLFAPAWPVDRIPCFGDLLLAIDVAASKIEEVVQVGGTLPSTSARQSGLSTAIVRNPTSRGPRCTT